MKKILFHDCMINNKWASVPIASPNISYGPYVFTLALDMPFSGVFYLLHTLIKQIRQNASKCQNRVSLSFFQSGSSRGIFQTWVENFKLESSGYNQNSWSKSASIIKKRTQFKLNIKFIKRFTDVNYRPNSFFRSFQLLPRSTLAFFSFKGRGLSLTTHRGTLLLSRFPINLIFSASAGPNISAIDIFEAWKGDFDFSNLQVSVFTILE